MREIKFRFWDSDNKVMCIEYHHPTWDKGINEQIKLCKCPIMQYTGLKDKNGKEIYEGDILRFSPLTRSPKKFHVVKWEEEFGEYGDSTGYDGLINDYGEIIGNIYENSDLLK